MWGSCVPQGNPSEGFIYSVALIREIDGKYFSYAGKGGGRVADVHFKTGPLAGGTRQAGVCVRSTMW